MLRNQSAVKVLYFRSYLTGQVQFYSTCGPTALDVCCTSGRSCREAAMAHHVPLLCAHGPQSHGSGEPGAHSDYQTLGPDAVYIVRKHRFKT